MAKFMKPKISLCAAAARPQFWQRLYNSLQGNTVPFELIFVGPNKPDFELPSNFKYVYSNVKPAQAYAAAFGLASGELGCWMADDCVYDDPISTCPNALDIVWDRYQEMQNRYDDNKTILSQCTLEDYGMRWSRERAVAFWRSHRFFNGNLSTPVMAPIGFINVEFFRQLGGYDKNFVCGQSENDIVMRTCEVGGRVELVPDSVIAIKHRECHTTDKYKFSAGYGNDRGFLQKCWVSQGQVVNKRLFPFQPFEDKDILNSNQGPAGNWRTN